MSQIILKYKNADDEVVELAGAVRVEVDAEGGIISRQFHPESLVGVEYAPEKADKKKGK